MTASGIVRESDCEAHTVLRIATPLPAEEEHLQQAEHGLDTLCGFKFIPSPHCICLRSTVLAPCLYCPVESSQKLCGTATVPSSTGKVGTGRSESRCRSELTGGPLFLCTAFCTPSFSHTVLCAAEGSHGHREWSPESQFAH